MSILSNTASGMAFGAVGNRLISGPANGSSGSSVAAGAAAALVPASARDAQMPQLGALSGLVNELGSIASALTGGGSIDSAISPTSFPATASAVSAPDSGSGADGRSNVVFMDSAPSDGE